MNAKSPLVIAVILNWNKAEQTATCVAALRRQSHCNLRVIVVDNGSLAGSLSPLQKLDVPFHLLCNDRNLGFTGGVNVGIGHALAEGADYVWLVNNDAEPASGALATMLAVTQLDRGIGLASPQILNADAADEIEFCGGLWATDGFHTTADPATYRAWAETSPDRIWLVGTALLLRRSLVEAIGLFDERFFAYWEDNDYSVRSVRAGFRNVVILDAIARHWSGKPKTDPSSKPPHYYYYMARNEVLFIRKYLTCYAKPLLWAMARQFRRIDRLQFAPAAVDAVLSGLWDGVRGRGGGFNQKQRFSPAATRLLLWVGDRVIRRTK